MDPSDDQSSLSASRVEGDDDNGAAQEIAEELSSIRWQREEGRITFSSVRLAILTVCGRLSTSGAER